MRSIWIVLILITSLNAQEPKFQGGTWLKVSIAAYNRMKEPFNSASPVTLIETVDSAMVQGFVLGVWSTLQNARQDAKIGVSVYTIVRNSAKENKNEKDFQRYEGILQVCQSEANLFSPPDNLSIPQLMAIVEKYLNAHPEKWSDAPAIIVKSALIESFPPKK